MIPSKYLAGFIQVITLLMTSLLAALADGLDYTEVWQIAGVLVGAVVTFFVPLLEGRWAAALKVGGAVLGAIIAAVIPLLANEWTASSAIIVLLAAVNALATQLGVDVRVDAAKEALAKHVYEEPIAASDPRAAVVAIKQEPGLNGGTIPLP